MTFKELGIIESILKAIEEKGYEKPTIIQEEGIKPILNQFDIMGCAQTGTGKTAAFAIPILQYLYLNKTEEKKIRALILTPTRELAIQIRDSFRDYGKYLDLKCSVIFGGVNQQSQKDLLKKGVDILVATPGRLLDLIKQKHVKLENIKFLVLDEADSMLDMGFIHDVKRIISYCPRNKQTLLFSATMPREIEELADELLKKPIKIIVNPVSSTLDTIKQSLYYVDKNNKSKLLIDLLKKRKNDSVLVFTKTKIGANKLVESLLRNKIKSVAIHGDKPQKARLMALDSFKNGEINVMVATDLAARGLDIKELPLVVNFDLPEIPETYIHRIGRTGRAGLNGESVTFCSYEEKYHLSNIEKLINQKINIVIEHNYPMLITSMSKKNNYKRFESNKTTMKKNKPQKNNSYRKDKWN